MDFKAGYGRGGAYAKVAYSGDILAVAGNRSSKSESVDGKSAG